MKNFKYVKNFFGILVLLSVILNIVYTKRLNDAEYETEQDTVKAFPKEYKLALSGAILSSIIPAICIYLRKPVIIMLFIFIGNLLVFISCSQVLKRRDEIIQSSTTQSSTQPSTERKLKDLFPKVIEISSTIIGLDSILVILLFVVKILIMKEKLTGIKKSINNLTNIIKRKGTNFAINNTRNNVIPADINRNINNINKAGKLIQ